MIEDLKLFFIWLKATLAKEALLTIFGVTIALFLSWIAYEILLANIGENKLKLELKELAISKEECWILLFMLFMLIIYGIRFVESIIKIVVIKKIKEQ